MEKMHENHRKKKKPIRFNQIVSGDKKNEQEFHWYHTRIDSSEKNEIKRN